MVNDLLCFAGFAALTVGLWWIFPPVALVAGGGIILALGCCGAVNSRRERELAKVRAKLKRRRDEQRRIEDEEGE